MSVLCSSSKWHWTRFESSCGCCRCCPFHRTCKLCNTLRESTEWTPKGTTPFAWKFVQPKCVCVAVCSVLEPQPPQCTIWASEEFLVLLCAPCCCHAKIYTEILDNLFCVCAGCWVSADSMSCVYILDFAAVDVPMPAIVHANPSENGAT